MHTFRLMLANSFAFRFMVICYGFGLLFGCIELIEVVGLWIVRRWLFPETLNRKKNEGAR